MTERNQLMSALGRLDTGNTRRRQHIPFGQATFGEQGERGRQHADACAGSRLAAGFLLVRNIHHMGFAACVEMSKAHELSRIRIGCA